MNGTRKIAVNDTLRYVQTIRPVPSVVSATTLLNADEFTQALADKTKQDKSLAVYFLNALKATGTFEVLGEDLPMFESEVTLAAIELQKAGIYSDIGTVVAPGTVAPGKITAKIGDKLLSVNCSLKFN